MSEFRNIVFSLREYGVPGICMVQENTVWRDSKDVMMLVFTVTSYIRPLLTVVVVTSL